MKRRSLLSSGILCLTLITATAYSQILSVQGRHVPRENIGEVIERETTIWAEVARKAIKDGHLTGWRMYRIVDGTNLDTEANIFFVNEYTEEQFRSDVFIWDYKKLFPDKKQSDVDTFSLGTTKSQVYYYNMVSIKTAVPRFIRVNYAKTKNMPDLQRYLELEQSVWRPFIQAQMDTGETNVVSWSLSRLMLPGGANTEYDAITVDGFETFADAMMTKFSDKVPMPDTEEIFNVHHKANIHVYELIMAVGPED
jgi:hypothetical protein